MDAIKTFATVRTISERFDAGKLMELKLVLCGPAGEIYLRVPAGTKCELGDEFAVSILPIDWK